MCGIVGYIGSKNAQEPILEGLTKLEYRGYDSAGISVINHQQLRTVKKVGKLNFLKNSLQQSPLEGKIGIGHTRWATHGIPSDVNSHPHLNNKGTISVVHNGIIENFLPLKEFLIKKGYEFLSDTDSEVIANLIDYYYEDSIESAVKNAVRDLEGAYALAVITTEEPDTLIGVRHESPLVIGLLDDGFMPASDIPALLAYTEKVKYLENGDIVVMTKNSIDIYDSENKKVERETKKIEWDLESASKEGFDHFMIKEIYEQPKVIKDAIRRKCVDGVLNLGDNTFSKEEWNSFESIYITACGTAFHAGEVGKIAIETWAKKQVQTEIASELKYYQPFIDEKTLLIVVSQSGETGDTLAAMREAKKKGAKVLAITNVVGSSIAREADKVLYCYAGPEISVASTKAYTTQLIALYALALDMAKKLGAMDEEKVQNWIAKMNNLSSTVEELLDSQGERYKKLADHIKDSKSIFFLGRGIDYLSAKEGALKLKEISYINSVAFPSGELKHGSIALIEDGTPVINIITQSNLVDKAISNIKEVKARGAFTVAIGDNNNDGIKEVSDVVIPIPLVDDILAPVISVLPQQLLAYETSVAIGNDVDKPRNLAKAVTVE
ncbi:MAG: glutamine--fructose-6-phosphate transaminase (isomerizing) [Tissierellia bacterium]|nr:glutamine--fructose-6-phosphate transaminase (isomerizing) [Tissierellia bacterium]